MSNVAAELNAGESDERLPRWQNVTLPVMLIGTVLATAFTAWVVISGEAQSGASTVVRLELPDPKPWLGPGFQMPVF
jgi:hypothetical protein